MHQYYLIGAVSFISSLHRGNKFSHAFAASSTRATVTSSFYFGERNDINRATQPWSSQMTSIFTSRNSLFSSSRDGEREDDDDDEYGDCDNLYMNFDFDAAREELEALVGAGAGDSTSSSEDDELQQLASSRQQPQSSLSNIRLLKEDRHDTSKSSLCGGASIASSPSMFDVTERPELSVELPRRPPLTSIERERRLVEIELLNNLREGDEEAISDLWSLWFAERGPQAESILREADELMGGHVREQLEAERLLRSLIEEYGVYFSEPVNRLATLYFSQGRMEEALALNKIVLAVKPWHFGSLSQIVMVYEALGDSMSARSWARFRLPNISRMGVSNRRREQWIEKAVSDASRLYQHGEVTNAITFGESDRLFYNEKITEDDAWQ
jgi:hypothetical protein